MSALGQKQTSDGRALMSALPPKANIARRQSDVRFVPEADISGSTLSNAIFEAPVSIPGSEASLYPALALPFPDRYAG
jgi:hypothetical protein